ncbi:hypothetical protein MRX96_048064 [Rhipicephalus microplus]
MGRGYYNGFIFHARRSTTVHQEVRQVFELLGGRPARSARATQTLQVRQGEDTRKDEGSGALVQVNGRLRVRERRTNMSKSPQLKPQGARFMRVRCCIVDRDALVSRLIPPILLDERNGSTAGGRSGNGSGRAIYNIGTDSPSAGAAIENRRVAGRRKEMGEREECQREAKTSLRGMFESGAKAGHERQSRKARLHTLYVRSTRTARGTGTRAHIKDGGPREK